jgi:hypothetical protein
VKVSLHWESAGSKAEYARILAELAANEGHQPPAARSPMDLTVNEVILAFWRHAQEHYRHPDGSPTGELENLQAAIRPLKSLYGHTPAREFDSACLEAIQDALIRGRELCRTTINRSFPDERHFGPRL